MTVRIGYIGSAHSVAKNKQLAAEIPSITLVPYIAKIKQPVEQVEIEQAAN